MPLNRIASPCLFWVGSIECPLNYVAWLNADRFVLENFCLLAFQHLRCCIVQKHAWQASIYFIIPLDQSASHPWCPMPRHFSENFLRRYTKMQVHPSNLSKFSAWTQIAFPQPYHRDQGTTTELADNPQPEVLQPHKTQTPCHRWYLCQQDSCSESR